MLRSAQPGRRPAPGRAMAAGSGSGGLARDGERWPAASAGRRASGSALGLGRRQLATGLGQAGEAAVPVGELGRQLVDALIVTVALILGGVGLGRFGKDRCDLGIERRSRPVGVHRGVGGELGPVERDEPERAQTSPRTEPEDLAEQVGERRLVLGAEASDRGMVGPLVRRDDPVGDVALAQAFDPSARALPGRIGVQEQRHHQRRVVGGCAPAVITVARVDRGEVDLLDHVENEPRQVVRRQPVPQRRWHQVLLIALDGPEVLAHATPPAQRNFENRSCDGARVPAFCDRLRE